MNRVDIIGRFTRDPELRYTPQGTAVTTVGIAINQRYTKDGEVREKVTFIDVDFWRGAAETVCKHFRKGDQIAIEGSIQQDQWEDTQGNKRSRHKISARTFHFIGNSRRDDQSFAPAAPAAPAAPQAPTLPGPPATDDIPF